MKRFVLLLAVLAAFLAWFFWPRAGATKGGTTAPDRAAPSSAAPSRPSPLASRPSAAPAVEHSPIADQLNVPGGTIRRDLEILNEVFAAWQTNFPHDGNPVGENAEITAALAGKNQFHFAFIAPDHPAINARGELCDRWGTPFFFHALSGTRMEIRSAGPDKKLYTPDDILSSP